MRGNFLQYRKSKADKNKGGKSCPSTINQYKYCIKTDKVLLIKQRIPCMKRLQWDKKKLQKNVLLVLISPFCCIPVAARLRSLLANDPLSKRHPRSINQELEDIKTTSTERNFSNMELKNL